MAVAVTDGGSWWWRHRAEWLIGLLIAIQAVNLWRINHRPMALAIAHPTWGISRTEHLSYLPSPLVARLLAFGHHNTVAKLWWIESYKYFNHRVEVGGDEALGGGERGSFERLYDALIALDPHFVPFYFHAAMNTGSVADNPHAQLRFLAQGVHQHPDQQELWRYLASVLAHDFQMEERNPDQLLAILIRWADVVSEAEGKEGARSWAQGWMQAMARRQERGLGQVNYWAGILRVTSPTSPQGRIADRTLREHLTRYGASQLQALHDAFVAHFGHPPADISEIVHIEALRQVYPTPVTDAGPEPLMVTGTDTVVIRHDPYGWPYRLEDGTVVSHGLRLADYQRWLRDLNRMARELGWPPLRSSEDIKLWPVDLDAAPEGLRLLVIDGLLAAQVDDPPFPPWTINDLLGAAELHIPGPP